MKDKKVVPRGKKIDVSDILTLGKAAESVLMAILDDYKKFVLFTMIRHPGVPADVQLGEIQELARLLYPVLMEMMDEIKKNTP